MSTMNTNATDNPYPVGSIYMSINQANPSALFGGTWQRFGNGKALVGVDENDADFRNNTTAGAKQSEKTGGDPRITLKEGDHVPNLHQKCDFYLVGVKQHYGHVAVAHGVSAFANFRKLVLDSSRFGKKCVRKQHVHSVILSDKHGGFKHGSLEQQRNGADENRKACRISMAVV